MGAPWTPADDRRLREFCGAGLDAVAIGELMDRSRGAIEVRKSRLNIRVRKLAPEIVEEIVERYESNEMPALIAKDLGVGVASIRYQAYAAGAVSERSRRYLLGRAPDPLHVGIVELRRKGMSIKDIEAKTGTQNVLSIVMRTERHLAVIKGEI